MRGMHYFRLPTQLKQRWLSDMPERCGSKAIREFLRKALECLQRRPSILHRLIIGDYELTFPRRRFDDENNFG